MHSTRQAESADPVLDRSAAVCILGAHRSGTSILTRLLHTCGVYLGNDEDLLPPVEWDNPDGYWENKKFNDINDEILGAMGGAWDIVPKLPKGWSQAPVLDDLRQEAKDLLDSLSKDGEWGWKDPRTMLTLEFWQTLLPQMRTLLIVRNPVEAALSLSKRPFHGAYLSFQDSIDLWLRSHQVALQSLDLDSCVVTHLDALTQNPIPELQRIVTCLEINADDAQIRLACEEAIKPSLRHHTIPRIVTESLPIDPAVYTMYQQLCSRSGPNFARTADVEEHFDVAELTALTGRLVGAVLRDAGYLDQCLSDARDHCQSVDTEINHLRGETDHLRAETDHLKAEADHLKNEADHVKAEADHLRGEAGHLRGEATHLRGEAERLTAENQALKALASESSDLAEKRAETVVQMERSLSWRATKPLRAFRRLFGGGS